VNETRLFDEWSCAPRRGVNWRWRTSNVGAELRNPGRRSVGLLIRVTVVRPPGCWRWSSTGPDRCGQCWTVKGQAWRISYVDWQISFGFKLTSDMVAVETW